MRFTAIGLGIGVLLALALSLITRRFVWGTTLLDPVPYGRRSRAVRIGRAGRVLARGEAGSAGGAEGRAANVVGAIQGEDDSRTPHVHPCTVSRRVRGGARRTKCRCAAHRRPAPAREVHTTGYDVHAPRFRHGFREGHAARQHRSVCHDIRPQHAVPTHRGALRAPLNPLQRPDAASRPRAASGGKRLDTSLVLIAHRAATVNGHCRRASARSTRFASAHRRTTAHREVSLVSPAGEERASAYSAIPPNSPRSTPNTTRTCSTAFPAFAAMATT